MRPKLLTAVLTAITALVVAPSAHAGWMTGVGKPPVFRSDAVCSTFMDFQMADGLVKGLPQRTPGPATFELPQRTTPSLARPPITISNFGVWVETPSGGVDPSPVVSPSYRALPFRPISIDPSVLGVDWPVDYEPGAFTHSDQFTLLFNRWLAPGTRVRVNWGSWNAQTPRDYSFSFEVQRCRIVNLPIEPQLHPIAP